MTQAADYAAWYETPRGAWIGETESALLRRLAAPRPGESVLDVGCGTGYFTAAFARATRGPVVGLDPDLDWLGFAARTVAGAAGWIGGRAERLPFPDRSFDVVISVTALCFMSDEVAALRDMLRVCRRRFALGLLNRRSLLWRQKGGNGGSGAYHGARWHTVTEVEDLMRRIGCTDYRWRTAVFLPGGGSTARWLEHVLPGALPWGAFLAVAGDVGAHGASCAGSGRLS
jgi:SAM-dependent methyltransferase